MSIDRFILRKLDNCRDVHTRHNLLQLFRIRIERAKVQSSHRHMKGKV
ncbi:MULTISPECIES: hypothetical protein [Paenibacillus]|nr:hypothetical protein [Paenibacillus massiliensis]